MLFLISILVVEWITFEARFSSGYVFDGRFQSLLLSGLPSKGSPSPPLMAWLSISILVVEWITFEEGLPSLTGVAFNCFRSLFWSELLSKFENRTYWHKPF